MNYPGGQPMKRRQALANQRRQALANQQNAPAHSEGWLDWFRYLHPIVQIALIASITAILILLILNPVAAGALVSFILALRGIKSIPRTPSL